MEHQESNQLLLSRTRQTGRHMAFGEQAEPAEEFDARTGSTNHLARLYMFERAVDFVVFHATYCAGEISTAFRGRGSANCGLS
jgi:hypothetical protein